jgi:hypothetical protein
MREQILKEPGVEKSTVAGTRLTGYRFNRPLTPLPAKNLQEVTHRFILRSLSSNREVGIDAVLDTSTFPFLTYVSIYFKVSDYSAS